MVIERRIVVHRFMSNPKTEVTARLELDVDGIIQWLAEKAWYNRAKKAMQLRGKIKCRVYPVERK